MNKLWLLTKVNLLTFFDIGKAINTKGVKEKRQVLSKILLILFAYIVLAYSLYHYVKQIMPAYSSMNISYVILVQFFVLCSVFILFSNIFRINGILFKFKDYDLLMSMPISKKTIILSKLIMLYLMDMIYVLLFMLPPFVSYLKIEHSVWFIILYIITMFIVPLVPIIIATIIGTLLTSISSKFKHKNVMNIILSLVFTILIMLFSFKGESVTDLEMVNFGNSLVNIFNKIYPLTKLYVQILNNQNIMALCLFILIPTILFILYLSIINKYYDRINGNLSKGEVKGNYKVSKERCHRPVISLYIKEIKRYFSSYSYVLNTVMGSILLTIAILILVFYQADKLKDLGFPGLMDMFIKFGPVVLGSFCLFNCSTHSSISLEGKSLWIIKSLPISPMKIFISKIMVNLTILIPTIIINATILNIYLKPQLETIIMMYITPIIYALFISVLGLLINLYFPKFDWNNEVVVIKQSLASFLTMFLGFVFAFLPFVFSNLLTSNNFVLIVTLVMFILLIMAVLVLNTLGVKRFRRL